VENIIEVNSISKRFMLITQPQTFFRVFKRFATRNSYYREIWALKDINFSIKKGEKIGFIGDNGSGKTTLARIILGIYRQTSGSVKVNSQAAGFLGLGIGMQRDLSILENIYIFGAIMGLDKTEIKKKLNSIIDFSELRDFIYSPLRDFSSGMYGRLVFSIAKEVDSEILVLDEVLGSGDTYFMGKCSEFFEDYKKSDRTMIMVSHDTDMIERYCDKILLLNKGKQVAFGPSREVMDIYKKHKF
jgi:ABC-type polysaccharide/polyol phosphate transport system ATPase subunit